MESPHCVLLSPLMLILYGVRSPTSGAVANESTLLLTPTGETTFQ